MRWKIDTSPGTGRCARFRSYHFGRCAWAVFILSFLSAWRQPGGWREPGSGARPGFVESAAMIARKCCART